MNLNRINTLFTSSRYNTTRDTYRAVLIAACESARKIADRFEVPINDYASTFPIEEIIDRLAGQYKMHQISNAIVDLHGNGYMGRCPSYDFEHLRISDVTAELVTSDEEEVIAA